MRDNRDNDRLLSRIGRGVATGAIATSLVLTGTPALLAAMQTVALAEGEAEPSIEAVDVVQEETESPELSIAADETNVTNVVKIGDKEYTSLAAAIADVPTDGTQTTVTLLNDITVSDKIAVDGKRNVIIDTAGHTLTETNDAFWYVRNGQLSIASGSNVKACIYVYGNIESGNTTSKLTVESGATLTSHTGNWAIIMWGMDPDTSNGKTNDLEAYGATIDVNGTVQGNIFISGNIEKGNSITNINNGAVVTTAVEGINYDQAIAGNGYSTINVYDGATVTGSSTGIELRAGTLNISGGTITGKGTTYEVKANGSGTTTSGAGVAVAQHTTKLKTELNITGGTISGTKGLSIANPQSNTIENITASVSDGNISGVSSVSYNSEGTAVINADNRVTGFVTGGTYSDNSVVQYVAATESVAQVNDGDYVVGANLEEIANNATSSDTINVAKVGTKGLTLTTAANVMNSTGSTIKVNGYEVAEGKSSDQVAADAVTAQINALPATDKLTLDDEAAVAVARAAYDALTDGAKGLVTSPTYSTLVADEAKIAELKAADADAKIIDVSKATVSAIADQTETGNAIRPAVTLTYNGTTLVEGTDYNVAYTNNVKPGTATVTITGIGAYKGTTTQTFTIVAAPVTPVPATVPMYRLYNQWSGEHLFTLDQAEYDSLAALGWTKEGVSWESPRTSDTAVYRLYNPYTGDHLYTKDAAEYASLGEIGWLQEDVAFYSADKDDEGAQAIYRLFNPYETVGTHLYTTDASEYESLPALGWQAEGEAFYGLEAED